MEDYGTAIETDIFKIHAAKHDGRVSFDEKEGPNGKFFVKCSCCNWSVNEPNTDYLNSNQKTIYEIVQPQTAEANYDRGDEMNYRNFSSGIPIINVGSLYSGVSGISSSYSADSYIEAA
jgi:hypothetical protein